MTSALALLALAVVVALYRRPARRFVLTTGARHTGGRRHRGTFAALTGPAARRVRY